MPLSPRSLMRTALRGGHAAPLADESDPARIADAFRNALYGETQRETYFGISLGQFKEMWYSKALVWAHDGDGRLTTAAMFCSLTSRITSGLSLSSPHQTDRLIRLPFEICASNQTTSTALWRTGLLISPVNGWRFRNSVRSICAPFTPLWYKSYKAMEFAITA